MAQVKQRKNVVNKLFNNQINYISKIQLKIK